MTLPRLALVLLLVLPLCAVARAEDKPAAPAPPKKTIENPTYKAWASFKVGASAKYEQDSGTPDQKSTLTWKLVELTAEKAVLEMTSAVSMGTETYESPPMRTDVPKTVEVPTTPEGPDQPKIETKEGTGSVTTPAGTFACKTIEMNMTMTGMTSASKTWTSTDVPSGLVKSEQTTTMADGNVIKGTTTLIAVTK